LIANRQHSKREMPETTWEKQMQLETTNPWKSKNHSTVPPGLMLAIGLAALAVLDAGCSSSAQPKAPAPAEVSVAEVICKQIGDSDEFTGRLEAVSAVEVRPRVSGYLQSVHFKEGAIIRRGELLFQIDPRPFQAEVDRLKGDLSQAKAQRSRAQSDFERAERLHNNDGMSAEEYDRRAAVRNEAEARIASTEAALRGAELNLEFTHVTAPITGRVGRAEITEGNLVESGAAQVILLAALHMRIGFNNGSRVERTPFKGQNVWQTTNRSQRLRSNAGGSSGSQESRSNTWMSVMRGRHLE